MLDFVVNLLIFFLVTAVFVKESGITVNRPGDDGETRGTAQSIVIDEGGEVSIDNRIVDLRAVRAHVELCRAGNDDGGVVIVANEHAPTGVLVAVADEVYLAGIREVTFSTAQ